MSKKPSHPDGEAPKPKKSKDIPIPAAELERAIAEAQAQFAASPDLPDEEDEDFDEDALETEEIEAKDFSEEVFAEEEVDEAELDEDELAELDIIDDDEDDDDDEDHDDDEDFEIEISVEDDDDVEDDEQEDDEVEDEPAQPLKKGAPKAAAKSPAGQKPAQASDDEDEDAAEAEAEIVVEDFNALDFKAPIKRAIKGAGYSTPTPIQARALPVLLGEPTDFLGQAMTGTGKTAAYALPILQHIKPGKRALQALVLTPTRELALQVSEQFEKLGQQLGIKVLAIYGGADHGDQLRGLREGVPVAVATPGRLLDHIRRGTVDLDSLTTLVLDEADQMMSLGFREEVEAILAKRPPKRCRIWLFSATLSKEVRQVAEKWLRAPKQVLLNAAKDLPEDLSQKFYSTQEANKPEVLCKLLDAKSPYGLIFCQTKNLASELTTYLAVRGYPVACLHGDKDQAAREAALSAFRSHEVELLVCTDVAARGLDIPEVTHVINYSLPRESDVYLHRVGRTARSGKAGEVLNLISAPQRGQIKHLQDVLGTEIPEAQIPTRRELGGKKLDALLARFEAQDPTRAMDLLTEEWIEALGEISRKQIAGRFISLLMPEVFSSEPAGKQLLGKKPRRDEDEDDEFDPEFEKMIAEAQRRKAYQSIAPRTKLSERSSEKRLDSARAEKPSEHPSRRLQSDKTHREIRRLDAVDYGNKPKRHDEDDETPRKRFVRVERFDGSSKPKPASERSERRYEGGSRFSKSEGGSRFDKSEGRYGKSEGGSRYGKSEGGSRYGKSEGGSRYGKSEGRYGKSESDRGEKRYGGEGRNSYGGGEGRKPYGGEGRSYGGGEGRKPYGGGEGRKPYGGGEGRKPYGSGEGRSYGGGEGRKSYGGGERSERSGGYGRSEGGSRFGKSEGGKGKFGGGGGKFGKGGKPPARGPKKKY